jgi:uncharacterized membrane protein
MKMEDGKVIFHSWTDCDFHTYRFFLPFLLAAMKYFCEKNWWMVTRASQAVFLNPKEFKIIIFLFYSAFCLKKAGVGKTASYPHPKKSRISFNQPCDDILYLFCAELLLSSVPQRA